MTRTPAIPANLREMAKPVSVVIVFPTADEEVREAIDRLRPADLDWSPSTLRLLDTATWMRFSRSRSAKAVRRQHGLDA